MTNLFCFSSQSWLNRPQQNPTCSTENTQSATTGDSFANVSKQSLIETLPSAVPNHNDDHLVKELTNLHLSTNHSTTGEKKEISLVDNELSNCYEDDGDEGSDDEDQLTSNCAIHNLEEFCSSSSSGCTSTYYGDEDDNGSVDWNDEDDSSSSDDDQASTASSSSNEGGKVWRKSWTMSTILGNPTWLNKFKVKKFETIQQFEQFKHECEIALQEVLCRYAYNTIGSFNKFYDDYKDAKCNRENFDFDTFYFNYKAKLTPYSLSCVGLSLRLLELFEERFGQAIREHCGMVSCEEIVKDPKKYNIHLPNTAKEHCLSALKFSIASNLNGKFLSFNHFINLF